MPSVRHHPRAITLLLVVVAFVSACASHQAELRIALTTINAASDGFVAWDDQHQADVVAHAVSLDQGKADLASYRKKREPVIRIFAVAYKATATAALEPTTENLLVLAADLADLKTAVVELGASWPKDGGSP